MDSATHLTAAADARGITRAIGLRCEVPQLVRITDGAGAPDGALQVHLVGGAAGPLGGDRWSFQLHVAERAEVRLRSVAASLAQPDPHGRRSYASIGVRVGDGGVLDAWPEPIVSVVGSHHVLDVVIEAGDRATVRWVDEVVLGRHGEPSGTLVLRQRLTHCGVVVATTQLQMGGDRRSASFGQHGPFRVIASAIGRFDGPSAVRVHDDGRAVRCALGDGWATWSAVGHGHARVRRLLADVGLER